MRVLKGTRMAKAQDDKLATASLLADDVVEVLREMGYDSVDDDIVNDILGELDPAELEQAMRDVGKEVLRDLIEEAIDTLGLVDDDVEGN